MPGSDEQDVERKVRAPRNKLTIEKFDPISDQIIEWINNSDAEGDGPTFTQVAKLVFGGATGRAAWSEMYARLCRKIMVESISPNVRGRRYPEICGKTHRRRSIFQEIPLESLLGIF